MCASVPYNPEVLKIGEFTGRRTFERGIIPIWTVEVFANRVDTYHTDEVEFTRRLRRKISDTTATLDDLKQRWS